MTRKNERVIELRSHISQIKASTPCADCGQHYPAPVMEFDHSKEYIKRDSVSRMVGSGLSLKTILEEVNKCDLVCANCHRMRTALRGQWSVTSNNIK